MTISLIPIKHGRTGNNLFQLADAYNLAKKDSSIELNSDFLEELGIPRIGNIISKHEIRISEVASSHEHALELIEKYLKHRERVVIYLDYLSISAEIAFKEQDFLKSLLPNLQITNSNPASTTIHIRAGDIWKTYRNIRRPIHPDYFPLPLQFYALVKDATEGEFEIISENGGPRWYRDSIKKIISPTRTHFARTISEDFNSFLTCRNFALSVSTLSWIASLLGDAKLIHYPKLGILDSQRRDDLLFSPPKPAIVYEFEDHVWKGGTKNDKEWLVDSRVRVINP